MKEGVGRELVRSHIPRRAAGRPKGAPRRGALERAPLLTPNSCRRRQEMPPPSEIQRREVGQLVAVLAGSSSAGAPAASSAGAAAGGEGVRELSLREPSAAAAELVVVDQQPESPAGRLLGLLLADAGGELSRVADSCGAVAACFRLLLSAEPPAIQPSVRAASDSSLTAAATVALLLALQARAAARSTARGSALAAVLPGARLSADELLAQVQAQAPGPPPARQPESFNNEPTPSLSGRLPAGAAEGVAATRSPRCPPPAQQALCYQLGLLCLTDRLAEVREGGFRDTPEIHLSF